MCAPWQRSLIHFTLGLFKCSKVRDSTTHCGVKESWWSHAFWWDQVGPDVRTVFKSGSVFIRSVAAPFLDIWVWRKIERVVFSNTWWVPWNTGDTYSCIKDVQKCILHDRSPLIEIQDDRACIQSVSKTSLLCSVHWGSADVTVGCRDHRALQWHSVHSHQQHHFPTAACHCSPLTTCSGRRRHLPTSAASAAAQSLFFMGHQASAGHLSDGRAPKDAASTDGFLVMLSTASETLIMTTEYDLVRMLLFPFVAINPRFRFFICPRR